MPSDAEDDEASHRADETEPSPTKLQRGLQAVQAAASKTTMPGAIHPSNPAPEPEPEPGPEPKPKPKPNPNPDLRPKPNPNPNQGGRCRKYNDLEEKEAGPLGAQPLPRVLEPAASKAAHFPAFDHLTLTLTLTPGGVLRPCAPRGAIWAQRHALQGAEGLIRGAGRAAYRSVVSSHVPGRKYGGYQLVKSLFQLGPLTTPSTPRAPPRAASSSIPPYPATGTLPC
eukprot:scaffold28287_cov24-Phaeocystis_antarctica.AAC.1